MDAREKADADGERDSNFRIQGVERAAALSGQGLA